jgi:hypothetical protein
MLVASRILTRFLEAAVTSQCPVTICTASRFEATGIIHTFDWQWVEFQPLNQNVIEDGQPMMFLMAISQIENICFNVANDRMDMLRRFGPLQDKMEQSEETL